MKQFIGTVVALFLAAGLGIQARAADDKDAKAILDKAIKAVGGEEKLGKAKAFQSKGKGKISFGDMDNDFTTESTVQGLDHARQIFEGDFGGNKVRGEMVLAGDKGYRDFGGMKMEFDKDNLVNEKRIYLQVLPMTLLPLKDKDYKLEAAGEEKVGDKPAVGVKVTGPDKKDFTIYFDKESGLPVKLVAKVVGFMGDEFVQETFFADFKEFDGIKKATKIENHRDGKKFLEQQVTEFKVLDKVDPKTFDVSK